MIAVVDDDPDARTACAILLERAGYTSVPFATARDAVRAAEAKTLPRTILMDLELPGESAGEAIVAILRAMPEAHVIALSSHAGDEFVFAALRAGAVGYLLKEDAPEALAGALEVVARGGSPISPSIARRVIATFRDEQARFEPLSAREREILELFADGASYERAAHTLGISVDTVRTHVRRLYAKLRVTSRAEALVAAVKRGLLGR